MLNNKKIGKRIALLRKENGYTQEQLAGILHVTGQAVSKWEKGNALPDTSLLPALAGVLKTSIDRLLTGEKLETKTNPYDEEYKKEEYYWGLEHSTLAEITMNMYDKLKYDSRLLDIGSGEGRDAIYFAKCGFVVDALAVMKECIANPTAKITIPNKVKLYLRDMLDIYRNVYHARSDEAMAELLKDGFAKKKWSTFA